MKNDYQKLMEHINTPAGLNDRVLFAARQQAAEQTSGQTGPKRLTTGKARPILRGAVCAACALALVLGTVRFYPAETQPETPVGQEDGPTVMVPAFSFGLTAYAAGTGETITPNANGGLAFTMGAGLYWPEQEGYYTGCLFQVTGEGVRQVALSLDRGGLYRSRRLEHLTVEEMQAIREAQARGEMAPTSIDQDEDGNWSTEAMMKLGASVTEDYDPEASYGFWVPSGQESQDTEMDMGEAAQASIDFFDGAVLTVTVTFDGGTEQTKTYLLSTGRLRVTHSSAGMTVLPQLAGDDEPCIYGIYAESEEDSRWFQWPVQDCTTISLSNPYGARTLPAAEPDADDPEARTVFHNGIDIPAPFGSVILAAADGTVTETGFDAERGSYLVLDHGDGLETVYATCRDFTVEEGDTVRAGEMIGAVGTSGMSTGPHLCFQVWQDGEAQNPVAYFDSGIRDTLSMQ